MQQDLHIQATTMYKESRNWDWHGQDPSTEELSKAVHEELRREGREFGNSIWQ